MLPVFRSNSSADERYVWHPRVHDMFGEQCHFYLLAGEDPTRQQTFTAALRELLELLDIASGTLHVVYGQYDAVLRFWATPGARQRFARGLAASTLNMTAIREFTADTVAYSQSPRAPTDADLHGARPTIERIVVADYKGELDQIPDATLLELESKSILVRIPATPGVKFYMFLSEHSAQHAQPNDFVLRELQRARVASNVDCAAIYSGVGFCNFLVKGIAPSYDAALPMVNLMRREAKDLRLAPWTLVVADHNTASTGESIDEVLFGLSLDLETFIKTVARRDTDQGRLRRETSSLESRDRKALERLVADAREEMRPDEVERFFEVLESVLLRDRKSLNKSLSFLMSIEGDIRFLIPRLMRDAAGEHWYDELRRAVEQKMRDAPPPENLDDTAGGKGFKEWSLYKLLFALRVAGQEHPDKIETLLRSALPSEWYKKIQGVCDLRNDYAHSSVYGLVKAGSLDGQLGKTLADIGFAIQLQLRLESLAESLDINSL